MRGILTLIGALSLAGAVAAAGSSLPSSEPAGVATPPAQILAQAQRHCQRDSGELWNEDLCGPLLLTDGQGRVYTNGSDIHGRLRPVDTYWYAEIPAEGERPPFTDTSAEWSGVRWAIVRLTPERTLIEYARLALHESFHRIQPTLGIDSANNQIAQHLDEMEGRLWLRLTLRALAAAATAPSEAEVREHVANAIVMSAYRQSLFAGADVVERNLELHEGLAEYTGWRLVEDPDLWANLRSHLLQAERSASFARSFPYATGPAWGLLYDRLGLIWRNRVRRDGVSLVEIGVQAFAITAAPRREQALAASRHYGHEEVLNAEQELARLVAARRADYRHRFVEGPRLVVPLNNISFDPRTATGLGHDGQVYGTLRAAGPWGMLETERGALVRWSERTVVVGREADWEASLPIWQTGQWRLELNEGWRLRRDGNDLIVVQSAPE